MSITKGIIILQINFQQARKMNTRSTEDAGVTIFTFRLAVVPQENNFCK